MATITLAKALKEKNRLVKDYNETLIKAVSNNSRLKGSKVHYNSRELFVKVNEKLTNLISFKGKLFTATEPVREKIFKLGELKSLLNRVSGMSCNEGVVDDGYRYRGNGTEVSVEYESTITQIEKDEYLKALQTEIDTLQDEIDAFNATHSIEV